MIEPITGVWWLPQNPDELIAGTLTISGGRPQLDLVGLWSGISLASQLPELTLIYGVGEGKQVTLLGSHVTSTTASMPGVQTLRLNADAAVLGAHVQTASLPQFTRFRFHFDVLDEWVGLSGFSMELQVDPETKQFAGLVLLR